MTKTKPTGPVAAAKEIVLITWPCEDANNKENKQWIDQKVAQYNAIIEKHCHQDKAVGKLVEAHKSIASVQPPEVDPRFYELNGGLLGVIDRMVSKSKSALAEYEKAEPVNPVEDKAVEKLVEACKMALQFPSACGWDRKGTQWEHPDNRPDQPEILRNLRAALADYEATK